VEVAMKKSRNLTAAACALLAATSASHAADIPGMAYPYAAPAASYGAYNWMGFYAGLNIGYARGDITNSPTNPSGGLIGLQAGYNWQNGQFVFGGETDLQLSNADDMFAPWKFSNPWFGTVRVRVGYAMNNILFYGTGGLAYGGVKLESGGLSQDNTHYGWTVGVGAEVGLTPAWRARMEYLHLDLIDRGYFIGSLHGIESHILRLGVNYRF
jgi:outer membrane immunogenic protein